MKVKNGLEKGKLHTGFRRPFHNWLSILFEFFSHFILQKSHVERRTCQRFKLNKNAKLDKHRFLFGKTIQNTCGISSSVVKLNDLWSSKRLLQQNIFPFAKNIIIWVCILCSISFHICLCIGSGWPAFSTKH